MLFSLSLFNTLTWLYSYVIFRPAVLTDFVTDVAVKKPENPVNDINTTFESMLSVPCYYGHRLSHENSRRLQVRDKNVLKTSPIPTSATNEMPSFTIVSKFVSFSGFFHVDSAKIGKSGDL